MKRTNVMLLMVACGVASLNGCSKSSSEKPASSDNARPAAAVAPTVTNAHPTINRAPSPVAARASKQPMQAPKPIALEKDYRGTTDDNRKTEIIYKLGEVGTTESVVVLGRLFRNEEDADLKEEMLNVLSLIDGSEK